MGTYQSYLIEANIILAALTLLYVLALRKSSDYSARRYTLLAIFFCSAIGPLLEVPNYFQTYTSELPANIITLPAVFVGTNNEPAITEQTTSIPITSNILKVLVAGTIVMFLWTIVRIFWIIALALTHNRTRMGELYIFRTTLRIAPFSFFNFVALPVRSGPDEPIILSHEREHFRQLHTIDRILAEIVRSITWINPASWWLVREIQTVHEFEVDQRVIAVHSPAVYADVLARSALTRSGHFIVHHFHSFTLQRLRQLSQPVKSLLWIHKIAIAFVVVMAGFVAGCQNSGNDLPAEVTQKRQELEKQFPGNKVIVIEVTDTIGVRTTKEMTGVRIESIMALSEYTPPRHFIFLIDSGRAHIEKEKPMALGDGFYVVEQPALPPGGLDAFAEWMSANLTIPDAARKAGVSGSVVIEFVVEPNGQLSNWKVINSLGYGCDEEALRVLKSSGTWTPSQQRQQTIAQTIRVPVVFGATSNAESITRIKRKLIISTVMDTSSSGIVVDGFVVDESHQPVRGVNIVVQGGTLGTHTSRNGYFHLDLDSKATLGFSHVNYETALLEVPLE